MSHPSYRYPLTVVTDGGAVTSVRDPDALAAVKRRYGATTGWHLFSRKDGARTLAQHPTIESLEHLGSFNSVHGPDNAARILRHVADQQGRSRAAEMARQANVTGSEGVAPPASNPVSRVVNGRVGGAS